MSRIVIITLIYHRRLILSFFFITIAFVFCHLFIIMFKVVLIYLKRSSINTLFKITKVKKEVCQTPVRSIKSALEPDSWQLENMCSLKSNISQRKYSYVILSAASKYSSKRRIYSSRHREGASNRLANHNDLFKRLKNALPTDLIAVRGYYTTRIAANKRSTKIYDLIWRF
jgi:hypothetical protein